MTENEAKKKLEIFDRERKEYMASMPSTPYFDRAKADNFTQSLNIAIKALEEIQQYRAIGTVEECQEARERQRAKKPIKVENNGFRYTDSYICPNCEKGFTGTGIADFCYHCGQAIDFSEV